MNLRTLLPLLLLAACAGEPATGRFTDPVRQAALTATTGFGDMGQFQGDPAGAARAVAQLEFLTDTFRRDPVWAPRASPVLAGQLRRAQEETRTALGIDPATSPQTVIDALRGAAQSIDDADTAAAQRALSAPFFTLGGAATLARLSSMQGTRTLSAAAQAVNQAGMVGISGPR